MPNKPALKRPPSETCSASTNSATAAATKKEEQKSDDSGRTKLHITPFSPALLKVYIPQSLISSATNISYHTVETFPEKGFGYVELPTMEAQKLKKKLSGSILKGSKVRIEDAKPEKRKAAEKDEMPAKEEKDRPAKRAKKEKRKQGVLEGFELPDSRKVKRGWTEPSVPGKTKKDKKDKKEKTKESKYTKEPEMLFKTKLTPVAAAAVEASGKGEKSKEKSKSKSSRDVVIHEFAKTKKHASFLKDSQVSKEKKPATEYVNGKGWVDEDGNIVEAETGKARRRRILELAGTPGETFQVGMPKVDHGVISNGLESGTEKASLQTSHRPGSHGKTAPPGGTTNPKIPKAASSSANTSWSEKMSTESSSAVSSDSDSSSESVSQASSSSISSSIPTKTLQNITLTPPPSSTQNGIHPLEALFKRPNPSAITTTTSNTPSRLPPINTSFSFFDDDAAHNEDVMDTSANPPHTPFTRQDLQWRGLRSAAPTPDTAAIGRKFSFPWGRSDDEEAGEDGLDAGAELTVNTKANARSHALEDVDEEGEDGDEDVDRDASMADANSTPLGPRPSGIAKASAGGEADGEAEGEESPFAKWFWEHRGENNRAWKKRRREAMKENRHRENKRVGRVV